jgi:hypothetical protein
MLSCSKMTVILEQQKESGLSVRRFCSNEGIAPSTYYYWQNKLRKDDSVGRIIPLLVWGLGSSVFTASTEKSNPDMDHTPVDIICPNGTTLRIRKALDFGH